MLSAIALILERGSWAGVRFAMPYPRPHQLLVEGYLGFRRRHLRQDWRKGLNQIEEPYCSKHKGSANHLVMRIAVRSAQG